VDAALDEALHSLQGFGPEFGPGLSNHGPMASEALVRLGRAGDVAGFVAGYRTHLDPAPATAAADGLTGDAWEDALGHFERFDDWVAFFGGQLGPHPVDEVVSTWVPRLAPGSIGAAGHGLLRTAHALRALHEDATELRTAELAQGLAYWAARYQELPGPPVLVGPDDVTTALGALPVLPDEAPQEFLITDQVRHLHMVSAPFEQGVASLAAPDDPLAALDELAAGGAHAYLANADLGHGIALVHAITVPMAVELLLPSLDPADQEAVVAYAWQAVAAIHVAYAPRRPVTVGGSGAPRRTPDPLHDQQDAPTNDEVVARAVGSRDEHAIKLAEAALRAHARVPDPALLVAAADAADRFAR